MTIFRMDPTVEVVGQVEVKSGAPAVTSKTKPAFRIAVTKVLEASEGKTPPTVGRLP